MPDTAEELAQGIFFRGPRYLFHWRRAGPAPTPDPSPGPPPPVFIPDDVSELEVPDTVEAEDTKSAWPIGILSCLLAAGLTVVVKFRRLF